MAPPILSSLGTEWNTITANKWQHNHENKRMINFIVQWSNKPLFALSDSSTNGWLPSLSLPRFVISAWSSVLKGLLFSQAMYFFHKSTCNLNHQNCKPSCIYMQEISFQWVTVYIIWWNQVRKYLHLNELKRFLAFPFHWLTLTMNVHLLNKCLVAKIS